MYSVDKSRTCYRGMTEMPSGYLGEKAKSLLSFVGETYVFLGGILPEFLDEIGDGIDCVILDTVHSLPGEILDFLILLPRLSPDAVVILHDISLNQLKQEYRFSDATNVLLHSVRGRKILNSLLDGPGLSDYPNIGAFQVTADTWKCIIDVFLALTVRWSYMPNAAELSQYEGQIHRIYDEDFLWVFDRAIYMNARNIFPVPQGIEKDMRVILYGAGSMGAAYWYQLKNFCHVIGWVDSNASDRQSIFGLQVSRPEEIDYSKAEVVIIAVKNEVAIAEIKKCLLGLGVPLEKIIHKGDAI